MNHTDPTAETAAEAQAAAAYSRALATPPSAEAGAYIRDRFAQRAPAPAVVSPPTDRAAVLLEAANTVDAMNEGCSRAQPCTSCNTREDVADVLRRLAAEAHGAGTGQQARCPQCGDAGACNGGPCPLLDQAGTQQQPDTEARTDRAAVERAFAERLAAELKGCCTECDACIEIAQHLAGSDQPATEAPKLPPMDPVHILGIHADEPAPVAQQPAAADDKETRCVCGHYRVQHVRVSGRLLCDECDGTQPDACAEFTAAP